MPKNLFPMDNTKKFKEQKIVGHNRWHPDIPAAVSIKPGEVFRADSREWFDGAIHNDDSADDVRNAPLAGVHVLTGPFHVEGAEPGDLLIVDILEIDACDQEDSGPFSGMGLTPETSSTQPIHQSPSRFRIAVYNPIASEP